MNAFVTGGGGFIGSALVHELVKRGFVVTSFSRNDYPALRDIGVNIKTGDLSDPDSVQKACMGMDIVFHVAAKAGISGNYIDYYKTNVKGTGNIIHACKMNNIKYLIYTSSASVVFDGKKIEGSDESLPYPVKPVSHYTATKALAEKLILQVNSPDFRTIALRPHIVYGPGDNHLFPRVLSRAKNGRLRRIGNGKNIIDVSYIDNVVSAHINAAEAIIKNSEASGKTYFITNGEPVLLWDFLNTMLDFSGHGPIRKSVPSWLAFAISALSETTHKIFFRSGEPFLTRFLVSELTRSHWFNISKARRSLNYNPEISNIEGLKKMAEHINST
ncbi:MAG: NAD-dependent epimerase/dehydratase family protein [Bacteroidales bacterium]|jgi:nucleoside-diphosphate-sugar epimerase|nr:NAD-dependent epimerase/dehydratase family protein [Bacteroidales bacterium]